MWDVETVVTKCHHFSEVYSVKKKLATVFLCSSPHVSNACCDPEDFPNNNQLSMHFKEFLSGYRSSADSIVTKFPFADGSRTLDDFSVGCVDGFSKILLMISIVAFIDELEISADAIRQCPMLMNTLQSFSVVRCTYMHESHPGHHFLQSLRILPNK